MTKQSRRKFTAEFKSKVVLEALKERSTIEELAKKHKVHPTQINTWKREFLSKATSVFDDKSDSDQKQKEADTERLYAQIGQLKVENDFLKKKLQ
ncbi:MAG: transposase [Williamsia sp.]|nr:transposase [Williamsia sp.]